MTLKEKLEAQLQGKKIALLGLGLENQSLLKLSKKLKLKLDFTICDFRAKEILSPKLEELKLNPNNFNYRLGTKFNQNLSDFDLLFRSPGWSLNCPGLKEAKSKKVEISSPMNLFFSLCSSKNIIGVTGSKGKGTTATLVSSILKTANKTVFLGGNIGIAPLSFIDKIQAKDYIVLELSSFQLEDLNYSPKVAIITNLYKEHLSPADPNNPNYHLSFKKYIEAKANLFKNQNQSGIFITKTETLNLIKKHLPNTIKKHQGKTKLYQKQNLNSKLIGGYNQENIGAALEAVKALNIKEEIAKKVVAKFSNLEHRLEFVAEKQGVKYFNNSFSTTPESTVLDLNSFSNNLILIAGGPDKGANFSNLAKTISQKVKAVILFPGAGSEKIKKALEKINYINISFPVNSMSEAIKIASSQAEAKDIALLSPACASFGLFKNYKERGNLFKEEVTKL
ncbi:MAG: UDP-N-acetylmuramoyl-L-alanine--D-glutamate ligase [Candidatus Pacebacteria bacterium]|nr:UDP-N-acetylmuramoyl-L-alanine--D-glutamate ligase [Candidatus Paceibacterota bacterium]